MRRGEGRVAAEIHFQRRGEPAQLNFVFSAHKEGRLGEVVLARDMLQQPVIRPVIEDAHSRRVAAEGRRREGIDHIIGQDHSRALPVSDTSY